MLRNGTSWINIDIFAHSLPIPNFFYVTPFLPYVLWLKNGGDCILLSLFVLLLILICKMGPNSYFYPEKGGGVKVTSSWNQNAVS